MSNSICIALYAVRRTFNQQTSHYNERFKFTGKERDNESNYDYFGARYYSYELYNWTSVDPLADKYPSISPYAYCSNNPIKNVDSDGNEVLNMMNPYSTDIEGQILYNAANNFVDKPQNHIFFISHGSPDNMYPYNMDDMTAESFVQYLSSNSELWNNTQDKTKLIITLVSCETGQGENSIAKEISKLLPNVTIVAPTEEVKAVGQGKESTIIGVYKSEAKNLLDFKNIEYQGEWKSYKNGEVIGTSDNPKIKVITLPHPCS